MKRWIELAASLYPARWQQRYGPEFRALLAELDPGWREFLNVLGGALKMQLQTGEALYVKLAAIFALLGMLAALAASFAAPREYSSSTVLRMVPAANEKKAEQLVLSAVQEVTSRKSLLEVIERKDLDLYRGERLRLPLEDVIGLMRSKLLIHVVSIKEQGLAVRVEYLYRDPYKAQIAVNAIAGKLAGSFGSTSIQGQNLTILQQADLPLHSVVPNRMVFVAVGLVLGILLGIFTALFIRQMRSTLLLTAMAAAGCILGAGFSLLVPNRYISTAVIRIIPTDKNAGSDAAARLQQAAVTAVSDQSLSELLRRPDLDLYRKERASVPLTKVMQRVREHDLKLRLTRPGEIPVASTAGATAMEITFEYPDPMKAQRTVQAIMLQMMEQDQTVSQTTRLPANIEVLENASLPQSPGFPNRPVISGIGLASGLLVGGITMLVVRRRQLALA